MAAENLKSKKRKVAAESAPQPKKQKKSDKAASSKIPSTQLIDNAVKAVDGALAKNKTSRKHVDQSVANNLSPPQEPPVEKKGKKKGKVAAVVVAEMSLVPSKKAEKASDEVESAPEAVEPPKKQSKRSKKAKPSDTTNAPVLDIPADAELLGEGDATAVNKKGKKRSYEKQKSREERLKKYKEERKAQEDNDDGEEGEDDQTAALLAGFESEGDDSDAEEVDSKINVAALKKHVPEGLLEQLEGVSGKSKETGVVFVGRIPHGFYEPQMQKYFSQFGDVTRVRVSRNKKTGASKHYAFVEFANAEVADIVAKTMDKYLMFGRILQCKVVPQAQVHAKLFDGANRRFKIVPRNKLAGAQMKHGAERPVWEKRIANEAKRREVTSKKLKEKLGYEFEPPQLRSVEDVPKNVLALGDASDKQSLPDSLAVEVGSGVHVDQTQPGHMEISQTTKTKKTKKGKKTEAKSTEAQSETVTVAVDDAEIVVEMKPKKGKKAAPAPKVEITVSQVDETEPAVDKKAKKSKKKTEPAPELEPELELQLEPVAVTAADTKAVIEKKAKNGKKTKTKVGVPEAAAEVEPLNEEIDAEKPKKRKSLDVAQGGKVKKSKKAKV